MKADRLMTAVTSVQVRGFNRWSGARDRLHEPIASVTLRTCTLQNIMLQKFQYKKCGVLCTSILVIFNIKIFYTLYAGLLQSEFDMQTVDNYFQ
jgi:hypothetical protein